MAQATDSLKAERIIEEIKAAGISFIVALPDRTTSHHLLKGLSRDPALRFVQVCKEDEGVYSTGHKALLLIQYTGLLDSVNALRGVAMEGQNPVCMMVGLLGKEPGVAPAQSARYGLRIVEPLLDVMEIEHHLIETTEDTTKIRPAVAMAYAQTKPVVMLIGREPQ